MLHWNVKLVTVGIVAVGIAAFLGNVHGLGFTWG
jgi:hypothetical protein